MLSLDPTVGDFPSGDVLIEGDRIVEVRPGLQVDGAEVIDASGMIVMPGFVDTHRHIWEGLLRNIGTDVPLEGRSSYISFVLHKLAPAFRPEDAYVGDLVSALGAIDAGITTLLDWSHIQGSPAHTDAVIQALKDSGLRSVFAYGFPWWGKWEERQPSWFVRTATEHFSTKDQMLTLALAAPGPEFTDFEVSRDHWKLAREADARITTHVGVGSYGQDGKVQEMGEAGLLGPDTTYIHCTTLNDTEIQMIVDTGGTVSLASPVEMMMGHGMPPIQKFLDRGLTPSLSVDVETNVPGDMFNQMRSVLALQRAMATAEGKTPLTMKEVLACATIDGAKANGLDAKVGTLTPGKQADLIMLRTDRINVTPLNDPATAVVAGMDTGNVDTVLIAGRRDETSRPAPPRRLAGRAADGRRVTRPRHREVGLQAPEHLIVGAPGRYGSTHDRGARAPQPRIVGRGRAELGGARPTRVGLRGARLGHLGRPRVRLACPARRGRPRRGRARVRDRVHLRMARPARGATRRPGQLVRAARHGAHAPRRVRPAVPTGACRRRSARRSRTRASTSRSPSTARRSGATPTRGSPRPGASCGREGG